MFVVILPTKYPDNQHLIDLILIRYSLPAEKVTIRYEEINKQTYTRGIEMKTQTRLYIDIDGVLLTARDTRPADNVTEFIDFITENFDCYWLTTHCKGDNRTAIRRLQPYMTKETLAKLSSIKATSWDTLKTEAVDFSSDFYWLDDCPLQCEIRVLKDNNCFDRLIMVDLKAENELLRVIDLLGKV